MNPHTFNIQVYRARISPDHEGRDFLPPFKSTPKDIPTPSTTSSRLPSAPLNNTPRPKTVAVPAVGILAFSCGKHFVQRALRHFAEKAAPEGRKQTDNTASAVPLNVTRDEDDVCTESKTEIAETPDEVINPEFVKVKNSDDTLAIKEEQNEQIQSLDTAPSPTESVTFDEAQQETVPEKNGKQGVHESHHVDLEDWADESPLFIDKSRCQPQTGNGSGATDMSSEFMLDTKIMYEKGVQSTPFDHTIKMEGTNQTAPPEEENEEVEDAPISSTSKQVREAHKKKGQGCLRKSRRRRRNLSADKRNCDDRFQDCFIFNPNKAPPTKEEFICDFQNFVRGGRTISFLTENDANSEASRIVEGKGKKKNKKSPRKKDVNQDAHPTGQGGSQHSDKRPSATNGKRLCWEEIGERRRLYDTPNATCVSRETQ